MAVVESNVYALWGGKQTAKGTPVAAPTHRFVQVAGDFSVNRDDGSENFSDLDRFGDSTDFVNTIVGNGNPTIQAQSIPLAWLCYMFFGAETYTAKVVGTSPTKFEFVPGATTGFWSTFWKRVGLSQVVRQKFNDCKITSLRIEGSSANKVVKVIPTILSLDPGEHITADPTAVDIGDEEPLLWTEAQGTLEINGVQFSGASQFAVVIDDAQTPWYGDDVVPYELVAGNATINLEGVTVVLDAAAYARYCEVIYGTATPTGGTKPIHSVPSPGSFEIEFSHGTTDARRSLKVELPGVKWSPDLAIAPNPDGGAIELAIAGAMRKVSGQPGIRVTVESGDTAAHS